LVCIVTLFAKINVAIATRQNTAKTDRAREAWFRLASIIAAVIVREARIITALSCIDEAIAAFRERTPRETRVSKDEGPTCVWLKDIVRAIIALFAYGVEQTITAEGR
jgi:hypothetical protein